MWFVKGLWEETCHWGFAPDFFYCSITLGNKEALSQCKIAEEETVKLGTVPMRLSSLWTLGGLAHSPRWPHADCRKASGGYGSGIVFIFVI